MKVSFDKAEIHTFQRFQDYGDEGTFNGSEWIAFFYPYENFPIYFTGEEREEVLRKANTFRKDELRKVHEREVRLASGRDNLRKGRKQKFSTPVKN